MESAALFAQRARVVDLDVSYKSFDHGVLVATGTHYFESLKLTDQPSYFLCSKKHYSATRCQTSIAKLTSTRSSRSGETHRIRTSTRLWRCARLQRT